MRMLKSIPAVSFDVNSVVMISSRGILSTGEK